MPANEQRAVANRRERNRTKELNKAYKQLQLIIPKEPSDKMSKIHTLKLALAYIDFLNDILEEDDCVGSSSPSSIDVSLQQVKSPHCSSNHSTLSSSSYLKNISSPVQDNDTEESKHLNKRLKVDSTYCMDKADNHKSDCNFTQNKSYNTLDNTQLTTRCDEQRIQASYSSASTNGDSYLYRSHPVKQSISNELSINLRSAFREYRSGKRKISY